jgi:hypothetical protein
MLGHVTSAQQTAQSRTDLDWAVCNFIGIQPPENLSPLAAVSHLS